MKDKSNFILEAEYRDGYIHNEAKLNYQSLYKPLTESFFFDIYLKRPEKTHGRMKRWSMFYNGKRLDIDWSKVPSEAIPIRTKRYEVEVINKDEKLSRPRLIEIGFGYEYIDKHTCQKIQKIRTFN